MAELIPYPFEALARRMFRELRSKQAIFDLPASRFYLGDPEHDLGVPFHSHHASSPFGPAAGPHTQMAQNMVLSWLGGARILELKTVQVRDRLRIPRPCIDMQTVGYNVEWSQELRLEQSLEEYVKGAMLIEMLATSGELPLAPGFDRVVHDMSVGYDLAGIRSARVQEFIRGMLDARAVIDRLRPRIPDELSRFRDHDFATCLSDTLTLSTFHGCPPDEVEAIVEYLLRECGLHTIVKLNPMLLGPEETRHLVHDVLGYREIRIPDSAFLRDMTWEQAVGIGERLRAQAAALGLGFGVKFTNTLVVDNHREFFPPSEAKMYLSGPPLHVLAMHLVARWRRHFGDTVPISFSAGIQRANFPDAVALGLVPVTVCTDLLKTGGYGRAQGYSQELTRRMDAVGARTIDDLVIRARGQGEAALATLELGDDDPRLDAARAALAHGGALRDVMRASSGNAPAASGTDGDAFPDWVSAARLLNTRDYVATLADDARYGARRNSKAPRKIGSRLRLFDCINCDKCIPVCPNDANFVYALPRVEIPIVRLRRRGETWERHQAGNLTINEQHQIANIADLCNECGNCDVFCPEDGGPYVMKPRFFLTMETWRRSAPHDGFHLARHPQGDTIHGRFAGREYRVTYATESVHYAGDGFEVTFDAADPERTPAGTAAGDVDLTYFHIMHHLRHALTAASTVNFVNSL